MKSRDSEKTYNPLTWAELVAQATRFGGFLSHVIGSGDLPSSRPGQGLTELRLHGWGMREPITLGERPIDNFLALDLSRL